MNYDAAHIHTVQTRSTATVLEAARGAIGAQTAQHAVRHLLVEGERTYRSALTTGRGQMVLNFALPDGYLQALSSSTPLIGQQARPGTIVTGYVGDRSIARLINPSPGQQLRRLSEHEQSAVRMRMKRRATQLLAAFLLTDETPVRIREYVLIGKAEAPDSTADVLEARCEDDLVFRLFVDEKTHRLLMVIPESSGEAGQDANGERWFFSDYRRSRGLMLPHVVMFEKAGKTTEEWQVKRFDVNAALPADLVRH